MGQRTQTVGRWAGVAMAAVAAVLGGCVGPGEEALRDGIYEFELTEGYLQRHGVPSQQARVEAGVHQITLDRGAFVDRWRASDGTVGTCTGIYTVAGARAAFRWTAGCTGDWAMTFRVDGDRVTWSDVQPLDPGAGSGERRIAEVFNGVPWTRTRDVPDGG